jgi:hypothetical protein
VIDTCSVKERTETRFVGLKVVAKVAVLGMGKLDPDRNSTGLGLRALGATASLSVA